MGVMKEATIILTGATRYEVANKAIVESNRARRNGWDVRAVDYEKAKSLGTPDWRALITIERNVLRTFKVTAGKPEKAASWYPDFTEGEVLLAPTKEDAQTLVDERCLEAQTYLDPAFDEHGPRVVGEEG